MTQVETFISEPIIDEIRPLYGVRRYLDGDGYIQPLWTPEQWRSHRVYFVRAGRSDGPMKIGFTTDLKARMRTLRTASPLDLKVEAAIVGSFELEALLHRRLRDRRLRGEWYTLDSDDVHNELWTLGEMGLVRS